ncbi:MAG: 3-hydroxybutyryl-CoA dehydratase [Cycloclasticus pugetii]|jgi:3-hydroxybutyryl-CoA dehydratase|uniref:3-hydroxybutyryl-CoA dehydratase n=2 Tax=Cycloclasticus TaxID=34067 RepID=S5T7H3_9GAMM|nr:MULTISPECIES: MaoC family dehydratase [Cycloclasticus]AFT67265.1 MaoC-like dehydratase [Cycloclasticus sp. P1]AGS39529.1 3-hydroxybutyryl-CoA dehydratase [Cycloclasticus zancles 78-ME]ATI03126.1 (R)-hydratase [Cycloclasticus sp. PY97N]EPD13401.1 maoC-like dehydratase [Cycloclasticus pugetii]MDF1830183.1 MaoC family dehydratase [Cycloclasticus pugetii]|tara:strand:- start:14 stop:427 length:414 start_codon:yes stop_codon:yes gene_type:complete
MSEGFSVEEMKVGQSASMSKTVTEADIILFAGITGDFNPAHIDEEYAKQSMFKGRIAHGMLSAGFISATLAMKLPGPGSIYLGQNMKFKAPVKIGDTVKTTVTITDINIDKKIVKLDTVCMVGETKVVIGDCAMMKP